MKKRYIASPLLLIAIAAVWNLALRPKTEVATAEEAHHYIDPSETDPRHPIDVFTVALSGGETQRDVLNQLPTTIYPEDKVTFVVDPSWGLGSIVHVERALLVTVKDGKKVITTRTWANTVGEVLADLDRSLGDLDKANYKESDALGLAMTIEITRVAKTNVTLKESIDFETVEKDDPNLDRGKTQVQEAGEKGERTKVYEITREDGVEVSRKLIKNEVTKQPKQRVVLRGTKVKIGKTVSGKATYYDLCCTKVASNSFKKGTILRLTNMNNGKQIEVKVDDTGAFGSSVVVDLHPDYFKQLGGTMGQGVLQNVRAEEILNP